MNDRKNKDFKHTSGPWNEEGIYVILRYADKHDMDINESDKVMPWNTEDARLIAAAPEMLEVLIRNYEDVVRLNKILIEDCKHPLSIMEGEIKNIIEKATGLSIQEVLEIVSTRRANAIREVASNGI